MKQTLQSDTLMDVRGNDVGEGVGISHNLHEYIIMLYIYSQS